MKIIGPSILILLLAALMTPVTVSAFSLEAAIGGWRQSPSGELAFEPSGTASLLDVEDDLNYEDENKLFGRLRIETPLFLPNLYVMATPMSFDGKGLKTVDFKFGDKIFDGGIGFDSKIILDHLDVGLFYGILPLKNATLGKLNIDIGVNVRVFDIEARLEQESIGKVSEDVTLPLPMVFTAVQFRPLDALAFEAEGRGIAIGEDKAYSLIGRIRLNLFGPLFVTGGYRYDKYDIDYEDVVIDAHIGGPFVEVGLAL